MSDHQKSVNSLHLLSLDQLVSDSVLHSFSGRTKTKLLTDVVTSEQFELRLARGDFDLAIIMTSQLEMLKAKNILAKINREWIPNIDNINADFFFRNQLTGLFGVPVYWQTVPVTNSPKQQLLLYHVVVSRTARDIKTAHKFIDHLLEKEQLLAQIGDKKMAATSDLIEDQKVDDSFKASALRRLDLRTIEY